MLPTNENPFGWTNLSAGVFTSFDRRTIFEQTTTGVRMKIVVDGGESITDLAGETIEAVRTRVGCPQWSA